MPVVIASDQVLSNKDAFKNKKSFALTAVATAAGSTTTETAIQLALSLGTTISAAAASITPTSGKIWRIASITFATRGHSTGTAQSTTFNLRVNTAGATATNSPVLFSARCATPATALAWDRFAVPLADCYEITGDGTLTIGVTAAATYTTNAPTWDVLITGFEYTPQAM